MRLPSLRRKPADDITAAAVLEAELADAALGKGRPTPKRREAQGRRSGPPPPPPQTRREAYKRMRTTQASGRATTRVAASAGVESALPKRDQGPVRRLVRNIVDSRRNIGSFFLPMAALVLAGYFIPDPRIREITVLVWMTFFVAIVIDSVFLGRRIKRSVAERYPDSKERTRGLIWYGVTRATMIRRWRFPKPQVATNEAA